MYDKSHIVILEGNRCLQKNIGDKSKGDSYKPIKLYFVDAYEIGQRVTATLIDKTPGKDCWCLDDFEVQDIKVLEDDNRKD
jgi:hypothetical protein